MDSEETFIDINKNNIAKENKLILKEYLKKKKRDNNKIYENNLKNTEIGPTRIKMMKFFKKKQKTPEETSIVVYENKNKNQTKDNKENNKNSKNKNSSKNDKYKKINEEMIKKLLAENYPFPLIAYFFGNFFRNKPIRNYNDFLKQWELFIKQNGDKKIKLRTVQNIQGNNPSLFQNNVYNEKDEKSKKGEKGKKGETWFF